MATYLPPANINDFERSKTKKQALYDAWHGYIRENVEYQLKNYPAFFSPLDPPAGTDSSATPTWPGFPGAAERLYEDTLANISDRIDRPIVFGDKDPLGQPLNPFLTETGIRFTDVFYRPQDEYLEWVVRRDAKGAIQEILFTCEGPEYWNQMAKVDLDLVVELYRELTGVSVPEAELVFPVATKFVTPFGGQPDSYAAGDYNPYNKWNRDFAIHLTQINNTLGAEINLAKRATLIWGNPPRTKDPALVCCGVYGEPNRNSDPSIGAGVNAAVRSGSKVSLVNPIGLYIKNWHHEKLTLGGKPFPEAAALFEVGRGSRENRQVLRLCFRVPAGMTYQGKPLTIEQLAVDGESLRTGGQLAKLIDVHLFAMTAPGAPAQTPRACEGKPCFAKGHSQFIVTIGASSQCPPDGVPLDLPIDPGTALTDAVGLKAAGSLTDAVGLTDAVSEEAPRWARLTRLRRR